MKQKKAVKRKVQRRKFDPIRRKVTFDVVDSEGNPVKYVEKEEKQEVVKRTRTTRSQIKDHAIRSNIKMPMDKWNIVDETSLRKTATRGVIQLFNGVRKQQSIIERLKNSNIPDFKKDKLIKSHGKCEFLSMIRQIAESHNDKKANSVPQWLESIDNVHD